LDRRWVGYSLYGRFGHDETLFLVPDSKTLFLGHTDYSLATMPTELLRPPALPSFWTILQAKLWCKLQCEDHVGSPKRRYLTQPLTWTVLVLYRSWTRRKENGNLCSFWEVMLPNLMAGKVKGLTGNHGLIQIAAGVNWALKAECDEEWGKRHSYYSTLVPLSLSVEWIINVALRQY